MKTDKQWESRARELGIHDEMHMPGALLPSQIQPALQLGREMADEVRKDCRDTLLPIVKQRAADERAEEIARSLDRLAYTASAEIARSTITKPKTREQVLEDALRRIRDEVHGPGALDPKGVARRALDWRPDPTT